MIRISVSDLESLRFWRASEDATLADLVARLSHTEPPTPQMGAGRALAKLFERADEIDDAGALDVFDVDGWRFRFELDAEVSLAPVRELKGEAVFETPSGPVTLVGKVDGLDALRVRDQKLTERWDAEQYLDSLQWRAYLVMFGAREFVYDIFVGRYASEQELDGVNSVTIYDYHRLAFFSYPGMRADVERAVSELAEVVVRFLPDRVQPDTEERA